MRKFAVAAVVCLFAAGSAWAQEAKTDESIFIKGTNQSSWPLVITDGAGFRWDIYQNGSISNGQNNAYSSGMQLHVNDSVFSGGAAQRSKDGREVQTGPWSLSVSGGQLKVWRRVYVDNKLGYARWVDIFENVGKQNVDLRVRYYNNMGNTIQVAQTASGNRVAEKDCWIITHDGGTGRPAVGHVFASRGNKFRPTVECNTGNNSMYYNFSLKIPAGKMTALCLFEVQRNSVADAQKALQTLNPVRETGNLPAALRKLVANMAGSVLSLETVELPRDDKDLAILRGGDEYRGTLKNEKYIVSTFYGKIELAQAQVIGLVVPSADDPQAQVVLADGQVLAGKIESGPLLFELDNGSEMTLPVDKVQSISYRVSAEKPAEITLKSAMVVLRNGQQLFFREDDAACAYHTEYGDLKLSSRDLVAVFTDTPEGGLHRVMFRSGSVLSGLLAAEELSFQLELGPKLTVKRSLISRLAFPGVPDEKGQLASVVLRNEDQLFGQLADEKLTLKGSFGAGGATTVASEDIASLETVPGAFGRVQIKLHSGSSLSGKLTEERIKFKIDGGPELPLFVGHVISITCPKPAPKSTSGPASGPAEPATDSDTDAAPSAAGTEKPAKPAKLSPAKAAAVANVAGKLSPEELSSRIAELTKRQAEIQAMRDECTKAGKTDKAAELEKEAQQLQAMIDVLVKRPGQ
jgi:hypothetical protein